MTCENCEIQEALNYGQRKSDFTLIREAREALELFSARLHRNSYDAYNKTRSIDFDRKRLDVERLILAVNSIESAMYIEAANNRLDYVLKEPDKLDEEQRRLDKALAEEAAEHLARKRRDEDDDRNRANWNRLQAVQSLHNTMQKRRGMPGY